MLHHALNPDGVEKKREEKKSAVKTNTGAVPPRPPCKERSRRVFRLSLPGCREKALFDEGGNCRRIVQVQNRHVQLQRCIAGNSHQGRVVLLSTAEEGRTPLPAV